MEYKLTPVNLDKSGRVLSLGNDKIALIDADTIAFSSALSTEIEVQIFPEWAYSTPEEYREVLDKLPSPDATSYWELDLNLAVDKVKRRIDDILLATGCQSYELHFSEGRETFRHNLTSTYKQKRTNTRYPADLSLLKKTLAEEMNGEVHTHWEADDAVVAKYDPDKYVLVATDKDVLNSLEGKHYNYYFSAKHSIDPKWVEVDSITAWKWKYIQTLTGDDTDGIKGIYGIANITANKILQGVTDDIEAWDKVVDTYISNNRTVEDAIMNMRLVNMHQLKYTEGDYKLVLWEPDDATN